MLKLRQSDVNKIKGINEAMCSDKPKMVRKNVFYPGYSFYPNLNIGLKTVVRADLDIINEYQEGSYTPPLIVYDAGLMGRGVQAYCEIPKDTFLGTYSGDIVSCSLMN